MTRRRSLAVDRVVLMFQAFGIDIKERWQLCRTPEEQVDAFEAARAEAKIYHRRLAMDLHPDRGGDEERLKEVNAVWSMLQKVEMKPTPKRKSAINVHEATQRTPAGNPFVTFVGVMYDTKASTTKPEAEELRTMIDLLNHIRKTVV